MHTMERQIHSGAHSLEAMDVRTAMVVVEPGMVSFPSPADVSAPTAKRVGSIIAAYRLMDVLYALQSPSTSAKNPRHAKMPQPGLLPSDKVSIALKVRLMSE